MAAPLLHRDPPGIATTLTDAYGSDHVFSSDDRGRATIRHVQPELVRSLCHCTGWHPLKDCPVFFHTPG